MIAVFNRQNFLFVFLTGLFIWALSISLLKERYEWMVIPFALVFFYAGWLYRETVFYILIAALPFSFEYHFTPALGTDIPDEFLMLFVSCLFLGYWIRFPASITRNMVKHPLIILLFAGLAWTILAVIFSEQPMISLKFLLAKTWYTGAFIMAPLILFRKKENIKTTAIVLGVSLMVVVLISLARHSQYGFSFASINKALFPFFRNHVNYSAMLVCVMPVLWVLMITAKTKTIKALAGTAIIIALAALFFSFSRGAWLALPAGLMAGWLIKKKAMVHAYLILLILVTGSLLWLKSNDNYLKYTHDFRTTIYHKDFKEHLIATYKLKDVSTAERFYRWIAGVRMIKDKPFVGYGPNTFYDHYKPYAVPAFKTWVSDNKEHSTVHNYFLLLAIEQGIPALVIFLALLGAMFYYAQSLYHRIADRLYKLVVLNTGIIVAMIMILIFLSDLIETDKIGSLFFLCLSMLVAVDINTKKNKLVS